MNFLNRRMFQEGGDANQNFITIGGGRTIPVNVNEFKNQVSGLTDSQVFALAKDIAAGNRQASPAVKQILDQEANYRDIPFFPGRYSFGAFLEDTPRVTTKVLGPLVRGILGSTTSEKMRAGLPQVLENQGLKGNLENITEYDSDLFDTSMSNLKDTRNLNIPSYKNLPYPFSEEAADTLFTRGGRSPEELDYGITSLLDVTDEVDSLVGPIRQEPSVVDSPNLNLIEDLDEVGEPDTARTFSPIDQEGKTLSFSGSAPEMEAKRLAYEKSLIGVDEFGFPIERPGAINQRPTRPLSITDFSDELKDLKPVNVLKTEIESKEEMQEKFLPDLKPTLINVDTSITQKEADAINKKDQKERDDPVTTISNKPGFFGSDNFLNFIRNVGGELVRTGQFGTGLASGAAKAAEERAARELLADQEERKYQKEIELAQAKARATYKPDTMTIDKTAEYNEKVKKDITDFEGGLAGVGFVDYAIEIIEEAQAAGEAVGGFEGLMAKLVDKGLALAGMGREFDNLSADSKVEALTKVVKQKNLQAILGESGRTISDKDREIIERVFGDLSAFEEPSTTLGLLRESRRGLAAANAERYSRLTSNAELISRQGPEGARFYQQLLPSLQRILGIDPYGNQAAIARARFAGRDPNAGIPEISLGG
jgi:hypothetical protein